MDNRKRRKRRRRRRRSILPKLGLFFSILVILGVFALVGAGFLFQAKTGESVFTCIAEGNAIAANSTRADFVNRDTSTILAADGSVIAKVSETSDATYVTADQIPQFVKNAFVSVEDRTFWTNNGINIKGMIRVLLNFIKSRGQTANGASTITQQLVKLTYLSSEKTLSRKVKEIVIALEITKKFTKEDIMEFYCNSCCFANGIYGIEDAAETYFGKSVSDLDLSEAAYLCAIPNRPEYYNPKTNPQNALERRDKILNDMLSEGYISEETYQQAISEDVVSHLTYVQGDSSESASGTENYHNYETTYAVKCAVQYFMTLLEDPSEKDGLFHFRYSFDSAEDYETYHEKYNEMYSQAKHILYTGGYTIRTSLDLTKQNELQNILDSQLAEQTALNEDGTYQVQGSMTVIDNETGKVICVIGGRHQSEFDGMYTLNRTYQGYQQPGSSIKPLIVYTPAIDTGDYTPDSLLKNIDVETAKQMSESDIANMDGEEIVLRSAVENSLNGCAYWLFANIGIDNGLDYLHKMRFARIIAEDYNMSACLGGLNYGVTTEEMANAYYTLENDGSYTDANCLLSITDANGTEYYVEDEAEQVYTKEAANAMTDVMKGVLTNGTAANSDWYSNTSTEAAGKTGTTNDSMAAWFCGYTPYYTISVWVGCDTPTAIEGLTGSSYPLSIWKESMLTLVRDLPAKSFELETITEEPAAETQSEVKTEEKKCTCSVKCSSDSVNSSCEVCREDYTKCTAQEAVCTCSTRCYGDTLNESCAVCLKDPSKCIGSIPACTCQTRCTSEAVNQGCIACMINITNCTGPEAIIIPDSSTESQSIPDSSGEDTEESGESSGESTEPQQEEYQEETEQDTPEPASETEE